jgi:hypothetical protein
VPTAGQSGCDPAYPDFCIPPVAEVGDLNCADIGYTNFTVLDPDPHHVDTDLDGIGCESVSSTTSSSAAGIAATAAECDPSYPDLCLPPAPPDLNCADIGVPVAVIHAPLRGATDPHKLDPDGDGVGCAVLAGALGAATDSEAPAECDPSYPDACLPPAPPDLNCDDIGFVLTVLHDEARGMTDPHNLDPDGDGRGCTSYAP